MKISISHLMLVTVGMALLACCSFVYPKIGYLILAFAAIFVIPPFVWVGIIQTRGCRRAFFLGAAVTGIPHFIFSTYYGFFLATSFLESTPLYSASDVASQSPSLLDQIDQYMVFTHSVPILLGCFGGLMGMIAHHVLVETQDKVNPKT